MSSFDLNGDYSKYNKQEVMDAYGRIREDANKSFSIANHNESIFRDTDGDNKVNEEEFVDMMKKTLKQDGDASEEDYRLLFKVLAGDDGVINQDEFNVSNQDSGDLSSFSVWLTLDDNLSSDLAGINSFETKSVEAYNKENGIETPETEDDVDSSDDAEATSASETSDSDSASATGDSGSASATGDSSSASETGDVDSSNGTSNSSSTSSTSDSSKTKTDSSKVTTGSDTLDKIREKIYNLCATNGTTPSKEIQNYLDMGYITEEQAQTLLASFTRYSDEDEARIQTTIEMATLAGKDITRAEAIAQLEQSGMLGEPVATADNVVGETSATKEMDPLKLQNVLESIHDCDKWGKSLDIGKMQSIIDGLTADELPQVIAAFETKYGKNFVDLLDRSGMSEARAKLNKSVAEKLVEGAANGNDMSVLVLCKEIYFGTADRWGSADAFIDGVLNSKNAKINDVLKKVYANYGDVNRGHSLRDDIKSDTSGNTKKSYLDIIDKAIQS